MFINIIKILLPTTVSFFLGILITPIATHYFYKHKMWKKRIRAEDASSLEFKLLNEKKGKEETSVPCVGGIIIWVTVLLTTVLFFILSVIIQNDFFIKLNFLSRSQTLLPLGIFILGAFIGLIDDILEIKGRSKITRNSSWYTWSKIFFVIACGLIAGSWFFYKLGMHSIHIPFDGILNLGWLIIPFVVLVMLGTFSGGVIDGLDGLSGGVLASIFASYALIAFSHNQIDIATLCGVITGGTLAFLWFNIPPARFYMGESGMMALTITLAMVAFMTDTVLLLPVIAFTLFITSLSSTIQITSRKFFNKKVFRIAPLHHHFEAIGWPAHKVTMRYWIISFVFAIIGIILSLIS